MNLDELQARVAAAEPNGCIKVNIEHGDGECEGIWAYLATPEDAAIYKKDTSGDEITVFLANAALIGGPTWGARLKVKTTGNSRPVIKVDDLIDQMNAAVEAGDYPLPTEFTPKGEPNDNAETESADPVAAPA